MTCIFPFCLVIGVLDSCGEFSFARSRERGILDDEFFYDPRCYLQSPQQEDWDSSTVCSALKHFERLVETTRMTLLGPGCRETLTSALDTVVERTQDFTDSAYTSHEHRENILLLCDRAKLELNTLLRIGNSMVSRSFNLSRNDDTSSTIEHEHARSVE